MQQVASEGFIDSGNSGSTYVDGVECTRTFRSVPGGGMLLHFSRVDLELGDRVFVYASNRSLPMELVLVLSPLSAVSYTHLTLPTKA